jgi:hypothetical protein
MPTVVTGWLTIQGTVFYQQGTQNSSRGVTNVSLMDRTVCGSSTITCEPFKLELKIKNAKYVHFKHTL